MELKSLIFYTESFSLFGSNRTFMELKYDIINKMPDFEQSSNRTFMELKLRRCSKLTTG